MTHETSHTSHKHVTYTEAAMKGILVQNNNRWQKASFSRCGYLPVVLEDLEAVDIKQPQYTLLSLRRRQQ